MSEHREADERRGEPAGERVSATPELDDEEAPRPSSAFYDGFGLNAGFVEELHERYQVDPGSVDASWQSQFNGSGARAAGTRSMTTAPAPSQAPPAPSSPAASESRSAPAAFARPVAAPAAESDASEPARFEREVLPPPAPSITEATPPASSAPTSGEDSGYSLYAADRHARVLRLIHSYRARGHRIANSDPLGGQSTYFPELDPAHYGFGNDDLDRPFVAGDLPGGSVQTLRQILARLTRTYCGTIGVEYTHVQDPGRKAWLRELMEESENQPAYSADEARGILEQLSKAELFEKFLHTKFLGQKRFSLEGAESLIPLLDSIVEGGPAFGIREVVLGMAHRGRLNVLVNILGKSYESIFSEFEDSPLVDAPFGSGDVKYHKGYSSDRRVATGERVHLTMTSNPSHLEAVDPVVEGRTKAKQVRAGDLDGETIIPVVIHGDAAFAGQGIVAETLNLSQLKGYCTGGTLHVIVNNQIGYTTTPAEARSTLYCSDVAKMIQVPIFHVNGDDPEAVVYCVKLALAYRQRFGDDIVIDMVCYRRHGHNEGDEPAFTQPRLYKRIRQRPSVRELYTRQLVEAGKLEAADAERIEAELNDELRHALDVIQTRPPGPDEPYEPNGPWTGYSRTRPHDDPDTSVPVERLAQVAEGLGRLPSYFHPHPKLQSLLDRRGKSVAEGIPVDWGLGEALAFGTLLLEGTPVRMSGQDSSRGTFSHRHAVFVDQDSGEEYAPLDHIAETQARFEVYDSLLSEAAVLGFEYGYSLADPSTLVLWEAQFGDFVNGAQVIIDQFITSAHVKWGRMSGLVMLLPHGYEGQGPEHSSARIERFLQICAEDCLQVVNCTTPAQYFHVLRRQMRRSFRAPMVIFTPKSLLRAPFCTSSIRDFTEAGFQRFIDDEAAAERPGDVRRLILCSGKVYYDLAAERKQRFEGREHEIAIARIEELYPWPEAGVQAMIDRYANVDRVTWCQEEPANMGPFGFVRDRIQSLLTLGTPLAYAGRAEAASPATGSLRRHRAEQAALIEAALGGL